MLSRKWDVGIGLFFFAASVITLIFWIPVDVETGVIEQERRSIVIGDAMAPTMASFGIMIVSVVLLAVAFLGRAISGRDEAECAAGISLENLRSLLWLLLIVALSLALMVWTGPTVVAVLQILGSEVSEYRLLRDTVPYKYLGFALGGFSLVFSLISWIEGRARNRAIMTAIGAVVVLIVLYDMLFDSLLLPPNGG